MTDREFRPTEPILERAVDSLRALPAVDREAIARTLAAAARLRVSDLVPDEDDLVPLPPPRRSVRRLALATAASVVLAVGIGIAVGRGSRPNPRAVASTDVAPAPVATPAVRTVPASVSPEELDAAAIPTQFVYDGPAHHVTLVGDFNGWDERATPLVREPGSALWSVTVPLQRGRHVYAFIVDSTWTTDRRAPASRDPDFGVEGSVIIVGRP